MLKKTRCDGTFIEGLHHYTRMTPYVMPHRTESTIYFEQEFDVTHTLAYIKDRNERSENQISFFQVFLCALVRTMAERPDLNRFVSGFHYYQRNEILFNFVAKREISDEGEEINVTIPFSPFETLNSAVDKISSYINRGKSDEGNESETANVILMKLPRPLIRLFFKGYAWLDYHNLAPASLLKADPMYSSVFITNVGSIGVDAPFHHNFERGTCGIFVALGLIKKKNYIKDDGMVGQKDVVKVTFTYDDRIKDGFYCARAIEYFREYVENPEALETEPALSEKVLKRLALKDYPASMAKEKNRIIESEAVS